MNNGRFATSIHIMTLLAMNKDELVSSEYIASSININPVLVRKELANLKQHGLIASKEGKGGGSSLAKPAKDIRLSEIYNCVTQQSVLGRSNETNHRCPIGKQINQHIESLNRSAEEAMLRKLDKMTLSEFCNQFI